MSFSGCAMSAKEEQELPDTGIVAHVEQLLFRQMSFEEREWMGSARERKRARRRGLRIEAGRRTGFAMAEMGEEGRDVVVPKAPIDVQHVYFTL